MTELIKLEVRGMTCQHCVAAVEKALAAVPGVAAILLDPRRTWEDQDAYDAQARKLVQMFADNFAQYVPYIDEDVKAAAIG